MSDEQLLVAKKVISDMAKEERFKAHPIVTEVQRARKFWPAEAYHQQYIETNGGQCHVNLRAAFRSIGKDMPKRGGSML